MEHVRWLKQTNKIKGKDDIEIPLWELNPKKDEKTLSAWAKHFREQYCLDDYLDTLRRGTKLSRKEYLLQLIFPDAQTAPGPSIRSGDFAEILITDYLEFSLDYWTPRERFRAKAVRNESVKGCDVIGIRLFKESEFSPKDELTIFESKAGLSVDTSTNRLQLAVDDSGKDLLRKAETLNFLRRRYVDTGRPELADRIERFQSIEDRPYKETHGAVALLHSDVLTKCDLENTDIGKHPNKENLQLMVIHGKNLMDLVHALYERAANEAGQ